MHGRGASMTTIADVLSGQARYAVLEADCSEVLPMLPDGSVDHCLTDPPFSDHVHAVGRMDKAIRAGERDFGFVALGDELRSAICFHAARTVRRWSLLFTDAEGQRAWQDGLVAAGLRHVRVGAWVKPGALPQMSGDRPSAGFEAIEIAHPPGRKRWNGGGKPGVWTHPIERGSERVHPTQKPRSLLLELLEDFTDPDDLVLDPFCGSGSLGQACMRLGRRYIGIDKGCDAPGCKACGMSTAGRVAVSPRHDGKPWAAWAREGIEAELRGMTRAQARAGQIGLFERTAT